MDKSVKTLTQNDKADSIRQMAYRLRIAHAILEDLLGLVTLTIAFSILAVLWGILAIISWILGRWPERERLGRG